MQFVAKDDGLYCPDCYDKNFAQRCDICNQTFKHGAPTRWCDIPRQRYHRECFTCTKCNTELAHIKFATKDNDPYCPECYIKLFAKICEKCRQPIAGGCQILTGHLLTPILSYQM
ncbi:hypothetical protein EB796_018092 [Bugula neritina]|uniref:LIM zinc-binding domain-containing protein n=1 Tax=Bugula neritina TaxID=10212 RepID=A0A7J7JE02_BUGNE|nr:hypothetical protein EB796_018092 [Bugula neritina]